MARRQKILFVKSKNEKKESGELINSWESIYPDNTEKSSSWASFKDLKGSEFYASQQANSMVEGTIMIRYRSDIKGEYQIQIGERQLEIIGSPVNVDEKNRDLLIRYKEV